MQVRGATATSMGGNGDVLECLALFTAASLWSAIAAFLGAECAETGNPIIYVLRLEQLLRRRLSCSWSTIETVDALSHQAK